MIKQQHLKLPLLTLSIALLVSGCGDETGVSKSTTSGISTITVFGDSLTDSGALEGINVKGRIHSVQPDPADTSEDTNAVVWTERINRTYNLPRLCNYYKQNGNNLDWESATVPITLMVNTGCGAGFATPRNFGVGDARINNLSPLRGGATSGFSISKQMADAVKAYTANDLVLLDGGGNDAADLAGLLVQQEYGITTQYATVLSSVGVKLTDPTPHKAYMEKLADKLTTAIQTNVLDKGGQKVVILNLPDLTKTPRLKNLMAVNKAKMTGFAQSKGADAATAAAKGELLVTNVSNALSEAVVAFNARLVANFAGNPAVKIVDFYTDFNTQIANPQQFGLTNVTTPACPVSKLDANGLNVYDFKTCTAVALSAATVIDDPNRIGNDTSASWWTHYAFSDGFHPTPYGYKLMGQLVSRTLAQAGWL